MIITKETFFKLFFIVLLSSSVVFFQSGYSYYVSFQTLLFLVFTFFVFSCESVIKFSFLIFFLLFISILSVSFNYVVHPWVFPENISVYSVLLFLVLFFIVPQLRLGYENKFYYDVVIISSLCIVLFLFMLLCINNFFYTDYFFLQNSTLVTNFSSIEKLENALAAGSVRQDLFYGEPSFLALVLFICYTVFAISFEDENSCMCRNRMLSFVIFFSVLTSLILVEAKSGYIYLVVIFVHYVFVTVSKRVSIFFTFFAICIVMLGGVFFIEIFSELFKSGTFIQRFNGVVYFFDLHLLFGVHDRRLIQDTGIHNGLVFAHTIGGVPLLVLFFVSSIQNTYRLSFISKFIFIMAYFALIQQNGGVFALGKVAMLFLLFFPVMLRKKEL